MLQTMGIRASRKKRPLSKRAGQISAPLTFQISNTCRNIASLTVSAASSSFRAHCGVHSNKSAISL